MKRCIQANRSVSEPENAPAGSFQKRAGTTVAVFFFLALAMPTYAYMDHGGRISRDFAVVDRIGGDDDLVFLTWGGTGSKKERLTLFALCADGNCDATNPQIDAGIASTLFSSGEIRAEFLNTNDFGDDCDKNMCWHSNSTLAGCDSATDPERDTLACRWAVEIPGSRGDIAHAPPVVDPGANRVFVATVDEGSGGSLWAFDLDGNLQGFFRPRTFQDDHGDTRYKKKITSGFYARPAVHPYTYEYTDGSSNIIDGTGTFVFAPGLKNAWLYVLDGRDLQTVIAAFPISEDLESGGGRVRFEPIVEVEDGTNCHINSHGHACDFQILVGVENGGKKRGLYRYNLKIIAQMDSDGIGFAQAYDDSSLMRANASLEYAVLNKALPMRLGGEIMKTSGQKEFLVANLDNQAGTALFDLTRIEEDLDSGLLVRGQPVRNDEALPYFDIHPDIRATHRTRPMLHEICTTCGEGDESCTPTCQPEVYLGQKEGDGNSAGRVYRFGFRSDVDSQQDWSSLPTEVQHTVISADSDLVSLPEEGKWGSVLEQRSNVNIDSNETGPWPLCQGEGITTTSWSSPFPWTAEDGDGDGTETYVFVGSSHAATEDGKGGIYRLEYTDPNDCPSQRADEPWFPLLLTEGWRTTPIATDPGGSGGSLLHVGTSKDRFFSLRLDLDRPCAASDSAACPESQIQAELENLTEWCYDLRTGDQFMNTGGTSLSDWATACLP